MCGFFLVTLSTHTSTRRASLLGNKIISGEMVLVEHDRARHSKGNEPFAMSGDDIPKMPNTSEEQQLRYEL